MKLIIELIRVRLTALTTFSALTGAIMAAGYWDFVFLVPVAGVFLLAAGATVLNQIQERDLDVKMSRTKNRPLPSGRLTPRQAGIIAIILLSLGSATLLSLGGYVPALLGLFAVFMYNIVYTALKKRSPFAAVPGAVIGAIPPAIGWTAAGRSLNDPAIIALMIFFFLWQVPHFWLLFQDRADEYREAGFPILAGFFDSDQIRRITFVWTIATAGACLIFPLFGILVQPVLYGLLWIASIVLIWRTADTLLGTGRLNGAFLTTNLFALLLMILLITSSLMEQDDRYTTVSLETRTGSHFHDSQTIRGDIHGINR